MGAFCFFWSFCSPTAIPGSLCCPLYRYLTHKGDETNGQTKHQRKEGAFWMTELTFATLQPQVKIGQSYTISGTGRNRVVGYRHLVRCVLGDIEESEWHELVQKVIQKTGEQRLFENLLSYERDHNYVRRTKAELQQYVMKLHCGRIFDDPLWVNFLEFNRKYRPEALDGVKLVWIQTTCCPRPGQTTAALTQKHPCTIHCPHCGRWSPYEVLTNYEMEESK